MSYDVVLATCPLLSSTDMLPVAIAASSWARRAPPNSRAVGAPTATVPAAASAGHSRRPASETPNRVGETLAGTGPAGASSRDRGGPARTAPGPVVPRAAARAG
ncbi:hypothetical protein ABWJ92_21465 [Streptomyces sp. NPDC000609]|uniref:hypothetical protein n=1 Tax=Streptomyces sp. NPDC000609 TaxID=3160957 RepID=UPI003399FDC0